MLEPIILLFFFRYLRISLHTKTTLPVWDKKIIIGIVMAFGVILAGIFISDDNPFLLAISYVLVFVTLYVGFTKTAFVEARPVLFSLLPVFALTFIANITEQVNVKFYNKWEEYFQVAIMFALLWIMAMWLINKKQRKTLEMEKKRVAEIENERRITEKVKAGLELQVAERTAALQRQTEELEHALQDLKSTQSQLVQSEKMASLGELTAGIAHEIQNPLNFINNFSEINSELIAELKEEIHKGNLQQVLAISDDIVANEEKINHHGKRADAIVKGMLQHSRSSSGIKEPVNINALAHEYMLLAYHGFRTKEKSFNTKLITDLDNSITEIRIIPQDISRVLLNLFNNAFYAVDKKAKQNIPGYEQSISLSTKNRGHDIEIVIADTGIGISQNIIDKIFQPFFTTKPTGQGTGLGLSLSYDIIKAHGGELTVNSAEGEGSTFIIKLPAV
jgi:two-component system, NtrC family, sensor kinase